VDGGGRLKKNEFSILSHYLYSFILTIIAWIVPVVIFAILAKNIEGTDIYMAVRTGNLIEHLMISTLLLGGLHWLLNRISDLSVIRKLSISLIIVLRFVCFIFILILYDLFDVMTIFDDKFGQLPKRFTPALLISSSFYGTVLYIMFIDTIYSWFYQIRTILGKNTFRNLLMGKYRTPRAEKRIFMFIDMQDSTTHAEQLGHVKFTHLIQECFRDFGVIAQKRRVDIYQYVGDEVIVSWYIEQGIKEQNCLRLFFDFRDHLQKKWPVYEQKYNIKPVFKAGVHSGYVTVAEIGLYKRGIEYLSDVLNTAARIQGICNQYQTDILISKAVQEQLTGSPDFDIAFIENVNLKGKEQKVEIFSVIKSDN
jgi:adenylate cyclase